MKRCPTCSAECEDTNHFCTRCGTKLPQPKFCSKCGASIYKGERFCTHCGERIENDFTKGTAQNNQNNIAQKVEEREILPPKGLHGQNMQPDNGILENSHEAINDQDEGDTDALTEKSEYFSDYDSLLGEYQQSTGSNKTKKWAVIIAVAIIIVGAIVWLSKVVYISYKVPTMGKNVVKEELLEETKDPTSTVNGDVFKP